MSLVVHAPTPPEEPLVPPYVPRSAAVGIFINAPMVAPHVRIAWEGAIIDQPRNILIWTAGFGTGFGANPQSPMTAHYQHVLLAGLGFRSDHPLLHWGFHVMAGPVWYRASYLHGSLFGFESTVTGYLEGRAQLGVRITPHFRLAAYVGYGSPFVILRQYPGSVFVGGVDVGLVIDWR